MLEQYYITGMPVPLEKGLGQLHQPTIKNLLENQITVEQLIQPFSMRVDLLDISQDQLADLLVQLVDFDLFFLKDDEDDYILKIGDTPSMYMLLQSLKILYNTSNVELKYDDEEIHVDDKVIIDRNNFTYLADVVLEMFHSKKPVKEKATVFKSKIKQQIWEKLQKNRKEQEKKKEFLMGDIINVVVHATGYVPYREVLDMTYYQLINSYSVMMQISGYDEYLQFKTSSKFELKEDRKHWLTSAKIKRSAIK